MKLLKYLTALAVVMALTACGGGGGSAGTVSGSGAALPDVPLSVAAPSSFTVAPGGASSFAITGGLQPYSAVSDNSTISLVAIDSNNRLTVGGLLEGTTQVQVRDARAAVVSLTVNVNSGLVFSVAAPSPVTVAPGGTASFAISGGQKPYSAVSDNPAITIVAVDANNRLTIGGGLLEGATRVQVRDARAAVVSLSVNVSAGQTVALFTTTPSVLTITPGSTQTFTVGGGKAPYVVTSANTSVATASLAGSVLTINALKVGSTNLRISDALNAVIVPGITVNVAGVDGVLAISPSTASTAIIGDRFQATITGGVPPYRASVGNLNVATAVFDPSNRNLLIITPTQTGQTVITIFDSENKSVPFNLTANAGQPTFRLSPSVLSISERDTQTFVLNAIGASGALNAFSSDLTLLTVSVTENSTNTFEVTPVRRCVAVDTPVTITVVDANRALATSVVTVRDNGNTPAVGATPANNCPPP